MITDFLLANNLYDHSWKGARCEACDKPCKNKRGVKIHQANSCYNSRKMQDKYFERKELQNFYGTKAKEAARVTKMVKAQVDKPAVKCEGNPLKNVFRFKYLGSIFAADGEQKYDIERRAAIAAARCGQLRQCFDAQGIQLNTKIRIYKAAVTSILTYGSEAWRLTEKAKAKINGTNARLIARITGKTAHEEASPRNQTFNIIRAIRKRKHEWLGHILRMDECRLVKHAIIGSTT